MDIADRLVVVVETILGIILDVFFMAQRVLESSLPIRKSIILRRMSSTVEIHKKNMHFPVQELGVDFVHIYTY